ncbi:MAG: adventurous gliding motility lipoprotein CglB [Myxococcaceae bacterium]|nr:adventurous gliding motility lipoprotein CglB [Myxococcaceae bacterium]
MRAKQSLLSAFVVGIVGGALVSACQTYDFEPVEPLALAQTTVGDVISAKASKPNMMVLLDTSGSMTLPVDGSDPDCQIAGTNPPRLCGEQGQPDCDVNVCPTRWTEMRSAMSTFLGTSGAIARLGLTTYPASTGSTSTQCAASTSVKIPIPQVEDSDTAGLQGTANSISDWILSVPVNDGPLGGTPTSLSLKFVGEQPDLQTRDRDDFILLLTDGLPNCNPQAPNPTTCTCTQTTSCGSTALVCLDKDASVSAVSELRAQKDIRTIVIGFGAETASGAGPETLNAMAEAGGFARSCTADADCGAGDTCEVARQLCRRRFYQAANQDELHAALLEIINRVGDDDPCLLKLDAAQRPSDPSLIVVYVDDEVMEPGANNWELTSEGVQFVGSTCDRILSSTEANPIKLEARAVQRK